VGDEDNLKGTAGERKRRNVTVTRFSRRASAIQWSICSLMGLLTASFIVPLSIIEFICWLLSPLH